MRRRIKPGEAGYTLVELLVVLAILALLVGIATPMVLGYLANAKISVAEVQVDNLGAALDLFRLDMDRYPTEQEGLQALLTAPPGDATWHGPYVKNNTNLKDPWGHPYQYRIPGRHGAYDLWSEGPHGDDNGAKPDIANW
jgi:general secretion pathway protein G